jgi:hypothetical protein
MNHIFLSLTVLALAGCGAGSGTSAPDDCDDAPDYSVEEAVEQRPTGVVQVEGYIVARAGETRLCSAHLESHPPQCGNPSLRLGRTPPRGYDVESAEGVIWTEDEHRILGSLRDDALLQVGCL